VGSTAERRRRLHHPNQRGRWADRRGRAARVHGQTAVAVAGALAERPSLSLSAFRSDFGAACDSSRADEAASRYFCGSTEVLPGSRRHRRRRACGQAPVRQTLVGVDRWLALPQQQMALRLMVSALSAAPYLILKRLRRFAAQRESPVRNSSSRRPYLATPSSTSTRIADAHLLHGVTRLAVATGLDERQVTKSPGSREPPPSPVTMGASSRSSAIRS
jgi:hypothetical protein